MNSLSKTLYTQRGLGRHIAAAVGRNTAPGFIAAALFLAGCGHKPNAPHSEAALPAVPVQVQATTRKNTPMTEEVVATVHAKLRATLEAKVSGRIATLPVVLGQKVKAGELLARIDAGELKARLEQAQASLEQADRDWKRISGLFENQAVTRSEYDSAQARQRVAQAGVAEARAMLGYAEINAPFDGVVARKLADTGDLASPGKPLLELEDPAALLLEADIPEAMVSRIEPGASLGVRVGATELQGKVTEISPSVDPVSRTLRVKLELPGHAGIRSGQFARLLVPVGESTALHVPASAVVHRGQLELAFVVAGQRAQLHLVKTGKKTGDQVEILSGLDDGDQVVTEGAPLLADGQPVEVK